MGRELQPKGVKRIKKISKDTKKGRVRARGIAWVKIENFAKMILFFVL
jgi:hypothetical protein